MTEAELLKDCLLRLNQTDLNYMKLWAVELGVLQTLQDILEGKIKPKQT